MAVRVLVVSTPVIGHVFPMVPVAWALRVAGHEVRVATTGRGLAATGQAGLVVEDVCPGLDLDAVRRAHLEPLSPAQRERLHAPASDLRHAAGFFAQMAAVLADGVVAVARRWEPELILTSQMQVAGLVAGAVLGVPVVEHGFGLARTVDVAALAPEALAGVLARHHLCELPAAGLIDVAPASMLAEPRRGRAMRYVPYNGGGSLPGWLAERAPRPRVAVTLGTVAPAHQGLGPVGRVVAAATELDAEVVLALDEADLSGLEALPPNVHPIPWVPLAALLETCDLLIHHGGAGTTLTALARGVPQIIIPGGADRNINAAAVASRGAGVSITVDELDPELVSAALHDTATAAVAAEVRAEIHRMPTPDRVAAALIEDHLDAGRIGAKYRRAPCRGAP